MQLKPCPFCGGEVKEVKPEDRGYLTICCGLVGSMISVEEWNTRPIEGNLKERIAELETELDWCKHAGRVMTELHDEKCKRITELEASYAEHMRQYDHQQERACNAERRLETYKHATKTLLAHIWSWER